jgi:hypothetical protein
VAVVPRSPEEIVMNARFVETSASFRPDQSLVAVVIPAPSGANTTLQAPTRHMHRQRDFGVGYGNSSGYGRDRSYTSSGFAPLFRCA